MTRDWSADESADPVGRQRPRSKTRPQCPGPTRGTPANDRLEVKGFPDGPRLDVGRFEGEPNTLLGPYPKVSGSIRMQVSQIV